MGPWVAARKMKCRLDAKDFKRRLASLAIHVDLPCRCRYLHMDNRASIHIQPLSNCLPKTAFSFVFSYKEMLHFCQC